MSDVVRPPPPPKHAHTHKHFPPKRAQHSPTDPLCVAQHALATVRLLRSEAEKSELLGQLEHFKREVRVANMARESAEVELADSRAECAELQVR